MAFWKHWCAAASRRPWQPTCGAPTQRWPQRTNLPAISSHWAMSRTWTSYRRSMLSGSQDVS
eukprot:1947670-Prorocentrum_lima.AAC.1